MLAFIFLVLYERSWWAGLSAGIVNAGLVALMALAAIAGYWALVRGSRFSLEHPALLCPQCGQSLLDGDGGTAAQGTGGCPSCDSQVIEPENEVAAREMALARSQRAAAIAAPRARYNPLDGWRGFLVVVAWIVSPLRLVLFDLAPPSCAAASCVGATRVWYIITVFWSVSAPGIIASAAWLVWHRHRAKMAAAR